MKLFENPKLDRISTALCMNTGDCKIEGRVESYTCKMIKSEKKEYKQLGHSGSQALSPPVDYPPRRRRTSSGSDLGTPPSVVDTVCATTLLFLRQALNLSFHPDYDFSDAKSEEFCREPLKMVMEEVRCKLSAADKDAFAKLDGQLWSVIDEVIQLSDCEIYSYNPDLNSDPYCEPGSLWSFNYFFYNKKKNMMVFFTCSATSLLADTESIDDIDEDMEFDLALTT